jgi:hypothetical protein
MSIAPEFERIEQHRDTPVSFARVGGVSAFLREEYSFAQKSSAGPVIKLLSTVAVNSYNATMW